MPHRTHVVDVAKVAVVDQESGRLGLVREYGDELDDPLAPGRLRRLPHLYGIHIRAGHRFFVEDNLA